jgi:DNA polymerase
MRELHIDIETYSSADLLKCGVYRYVQAPDFTVLLIAYAFDDGPVHIIDCTKEEELQQVDDF